MLKFVGSVVIHFITLDVLFVQFVEMLLMESFLKTRTDEQFAQKITVTMIRSAIFVKCLSVMKQKQYHPTVWWQLVRWLFTLIVSSKVFENFLIIFIYIIYCEGVTAAILQYWVHFSMIHSTKTIFTVKHVMKSKINHMYIDHDFFNNVYCELFLVRLPKNVFDVDRWLQMMRQSKSVTEYITASVSTARW